MIITRSPYRISFFGGGTDYEEWYRQNGGAFLSLAINYYTYITFRIKPKFLVREYAVRWRISELVNDINDIQHPIVREVLREYQYQDIGLDITYTGDLPGGTGIGSSSAFAAALILAVKKNLKKKVTTYELAKLTYDIEKNKVNDMVGIQDQIATVYGGFNKVDISKNGYFSVSPLNLPFNNLNNFLNRLVLVYSGSSRIASNFALKKIQNMPNRIYDYKKIQKMVSTGYELILNDQFDDFGKLLGEAWQTKKKLSDNITDDNINDIYEKGINNGALGGKLLGAGGSGFILFMCKEGQRDKVISAFNQNFAIPVNISLEGTKVVYAELKEKNEFL